MKHAPVNDTVASKTLKQSLWTNGIIWNTWINIRSRFTHWKDFNTLLCFLYQQNSWYNIFNETTYFHWYTVYVIFGNKEKKTVY